MEIVNEMGNEKIPSILKDPFKKNSVKRIFVNYSEDWGGKSWSCYGSVEFSNGNTSGEQKFRGDSFDKVVIEMKAFINELT